MVGKWKSKLEKLEWLVSLVEANKWQPSHSYRGWLLCCYCTASFGETGRPYFHRLSCLSPKYVKKENDYMFDVCLRGVKDKENIGLLFRALSEIGVSVRDNFTTQSFHHYLSSYEFQRGDK